MISENHDRDIKLFGLPAAKGRWLLIPIGTLILLCLGTVYSWSIFSTPLAVLLDLSATQSLLPYTVALFFYSALMPIAGFYVDRFGTRTIALVGGLLVGSGYFLSSFATDTLTLTLTYGAIAGTGVGTTYGIPMVVSARWFPDRKGLAVGLTIVGFGLSPLITAPVARLLIAAFNVRQALLILGIGFAVIVSFLSLFLRLPPPGWLPPGWTPPQTSQTASVRPPMLKSRSFYGLWLCYAIGTLVGLSAIGISSQVAEQVIEMNSTWAAVSVSLFAIFNGLSRPLFGWLTDRFAPRRVAIASYVLILIAAILMLNAQEGQVGLYLVAFGIFWLCLGGWLAIAPTATLNLFRPENYAQNYGIVFTAYGVGALLGTVVVGQIRDLFGSYTYAFYPMIFCAIAGILIASFLLKERRSA